ncbi:hypothetical protein WJX84_011015 [Apatococcus fuscideae]|uniref:Uncharacterized protein n=1 Tax=Apatococcus fuscideae TaxID=2026836 RepID=A0AAW1SL41_9CHLO
MATRSDVCFGTNPVTFKVLESKSKIMRKSRSVQCNELNPWGDTSGEECNAGQDENSFERDTCGTLLRVLTAKAAQRMIQQLMELNLTKALWLQTFCSKHPPLEGDKFIIALMNERPSSSTDRVLYSTEFINPAELATRILLTSKMMPNFVERDNLEVQRHHLEKNSYTTGTHDKGKRGTRGSHSPHDPKDTSQKRWFAP